MTSAAPLAAIAMTIGDGDVPTFADLTDHFDGQDMWDIRTACFGDINAAARFCDRRALRWRVGYDNLAEIELGEDTFRAISVTPAHALLLAAMDALARGKGGSDG